MNSLGPKAAQVGPTTAEMRPRAPVVTLHGGPRGFAYLEPSSAYCCNGSLTDYKETPEVLFLLHRPILDGEQHDRAPASLHTGRFMRGMASFFGLNQIQDLVNVSPKLISGTANQMFLATVSARMN